MGKEPAFQPTPDQAGPQLKADRRTSTGTAPVDRSALAAVPEREQDDRAAFDHELIRVIQEGGPQADEAFELLWKRNESQLFSAIYGMLGDSAKGRRESAQDVLQQVAIKAWRHISKFRSDSSFYTWAYTIARNAVIDYSRKGKRDSKNASYDETSYQAGLQQAGRDQMPGEQINVEFETPEQAMRNTELRERIMEEIGKLPEAQQTTILLREINGLSYGEIAEQTGCSEGTVMSRLFYGRQKLQKAMEDLRTKPKDEAA